MMEKPGGMVRGDCRGAVAFFLGAGRKGKLNSRVQLKKRWAMTE